MQKRKIGLFLDSDPSIGGTFQYNQIILEAVTSFSKVEFDIVIGYTREIWIEYLKHYEAPTKYIPLGAMSKYIPLLVRRSFIPMSWWRLISRHFFQPAKRLLDEKCDLWIFPSQDAWTYLMPVPSVGVIHDLMHRYEKRFPEVGEYKEFSWREWHYKRLCSWATAILVDSELGKSHVIDSYHIDPIRVHPLPYIPPKYILDESIVNDSNSNLQLPKKFLFYPAQFWEHKNHKILVNAIAKLKQVLPDIKLVLVGTKKNGYNSALRLIRELGLSEDIFILGYVSEDNILDLYRNARALVMPTFFGPTNMPPMEAMKLGCPVAVSKVYAMPEQLGDAALFFDPKSEEEIVDTIFRLWTDDSLCEELTKKGLKRSAGWTQNNFSQLLEKIIIGYADPKSN